jgi:hypothetical protein
LSFATFPFIDASASHIWGVKVPSGIRGRVSSASGALTQCAALSALMSAGFVSSYLDQVLCSNSIPAYTAALGCGSGRGAASVVVGAGLIQLVVSLFVGLSPFFQFSRFDEVLPDAPKKKKKEKAQ